MTDSPVHYAVSDGIATVTINRPRYRNAQNSAMTYGIDTTFQRAVDDDVRVVVLNGAGDHFSAGHDIGTPERDADREFPRRAAMLPAHVGPPSAGHEENWIDILVDP